MTHKISRYCYTYTRIESYFRSRLCATRNEAAQDLQLSRTTIDSYVRLLRQEWKTTPPNVAPPLSIEQRLLNLEQKANCHALQHQ